MGRSIHRLTALKVKKDLLKRPGMYCDGGGLWLCVSSPNAASWIFRYASGTNTSKKTGKKYPATKEMGLGSASVFSLEAARELAAKARETAKTGGDPIQDKRDLIAERRAEAARAKTFRQCGEAYIEAHRAEWKNAKHRAQWTSTLETYAYPHIGDLPVGKVDDAAIVDILEPIWREKTETAKRVRQRVEAVLDWAKVKKYRGGDNPARWSGHLEHVLAEPSKVSRVRHHPALPYSDIPEFMADLRQRDSVSARALEYGILNAARTGAVIGATWDEIDLHGALWTVPPERAGVKINEEEPKPRRVPLAGRSIEILRALPRSKDNPHVFQGAKRGKGLSNMALLEMMRGLRDQYVPHGFRSTFKDWCAEQTNFPHEVSEAALWHAQESKVVEAYQRGDLLEKRRRLMQAWADYCSGRSQTGDVVPIRAEAVAA